MSEMDVLVFTFHSMCRSLVALVTHFNTYILHPENIYVLFALAKLFHEFGVYRCVFYSIYIKPILFVWLQSMLRKYIY